METDPLENKPGRARILRLAKEGRLSSEALERALRLSGFIPDAKAWYSFVCRVLFYLGTALMLAGVFFFLAYNWATMGRFLKFGLVESTWIGTLLWALHKGIDTHVGRIFLMVSSILVGVWLGVYGQVYLTTADAYELFLVWTVFVAGWAIVSRFALHWLLFLLLINTTVIVYWSEMRAPVYGETADLYVLLSFLNGAALAAWEWGVTRGVPWLKGRWVPWIVATTALWCLTAPPVLLIFENTAGDIWQPVGSLLYACGIGLFLWFYREKVPDLFMLAIGLISIIFVVTSVFIDIVGEATMVMFLVGLLVIAQSVGATAWLRKVSREVKAS